MKRAGRYIAAFEFFMVSLSGKAGKPLLHFYVVKTPGGRVGGFVADVFECYIALAGGNGQADVARRHKIR